MKIAILSDIHANLPAWVATEKALNDWSVDAVIIAGDIIGYYYWPAEVVKRIRNYKNIYVVRGNHEVMLEDCRHSKITKDKLRRQYGRGFDVALDTLSVDDLAWLKNLPEQLVLTFDELKIKVKHATDDQDGGYLYPDSSYNTFLRAADPECDLTVYGHTHYPFIWVSEKGNFIVNPGSIGQPRDIGGLSSFVIFDTHLRSARFVRVEFNRDEVARKVHFFDPDLSVVNSSLNRNRI